MKPAPTRPPRCGGCSHFDGAPSGGDGLGDCYGDPDSEPALVHREQPACRAFHRAPATPED